VRIKRRLGRIAKCAFVLAALPAVAPGCAKPEVSIPAGARIEGYDALARQIAADPMAFLQECFVATKALDAFTTHFQRQERLGILRELRPMENITAEYRNRPFSVRFTWRDEKSEYRQAAYVQGREDNKVLLLPRKGALGLPPTVQRFPVSFAVLFQKARNPITDFGPRRMMERTIDRIVKAKAIGDVSIQLRDATEIGPSKEPCFHFEIRYPPKDEFPCKLQDLYVHTRTRLPVATYLWLPGREERTDETLDGMYVYSNLDPDVVLTDAHFVIAADPGRAGKQSRVARGGKKEQAGEPAQAAALPEEIP